MPGHPGKEWKKFAFGKLKALNPKLREILFGNLKHFESDNLLLSFQYRYSPI